MSKTVEQGKAEIVALCGYFAGNREAFHSSGVKEAHVRQSLIDPLFEALGWNVSNNPPVAPQYREVIPEDSIDVEGRQKAPDYTFRVGTLPKFFVEAKKCGVNISADPGPAYQLRRYGWSAKVALSILTDFEELAVYDCSIRPRPDDKAGYARTHYFTFQEYPDRWRELWDVFSRDAVWSGAFDQHAASKRKRGTSEVDVEFLKEIEGWRDELARNIALRNRGLSSDDLNRAVQLTIDRLIFLRMAEDRGLESYAQLLALSSRPGIYSRFMADLCRKADDKYNSGLFHFQKEDGVTEDPDRITPGLAVDDEVLKPILERLYFEHGSPYHFGVLPVEILGTVYERFLGKVIRLTADHHAKVEEKPEVRKAGGVYYTPKYIVDYIVGQTVGRQIEGKSPAQLAGLGTVPFSRRLRKGDCPPPPQEGQPPFSEKTPKMGTAPQPFRVLDMACGSGSFLLGAYHYLLDHCLKWYTEHRPQTHKKAVYMDRRTGWRLTVDEKKRILTTHIFGVDIDPQAVEVSKLSLLLKVLEGETSQSLHMGLLTFKDRALPNLAGNIKCGNSLIGPDYFTGQLIPDAEEFARVNAFDWKREFSAAMTAGGFDCIIGNPPYIRPHNLSPDSKEYFWAHYRTFTHKSDVYCCFMEKATLLLKTGGALSYIVSHGWLRLNSFQELRSFVLANHSVIQLVELPYNVFADAQVATGIFVFVKNPRPAKNTVCIIRAEQLDNGASFARVRGIPQSAFHKTFQNVFDTSISPETEAIKDKMRRGVLIGDQFEICFGLKTGDDEKFLHHTKGLHKEDKPLLRGDDIKRYHTDFKGEYVWYAPNRMRTHRATARPGEPRRFEQPKVLVKDTSADFGCTYEPGEYYVKDVLIVIPGEGAPRDYDLRFVAAIINSRALHFYYRTTFQTIHVQNEELASLPLPRIDFSNKAGKVAHNRVVTLVDSMLALHKQAASAKSEAQRGTIQRQIEATDAEIDRLVYDLYGLTKDEIAIVEDATHEHAR